MSYASVAIEPQSKPKSKAGLALAAIFITYFASSYIFRGWVVAAPRIAADLNGMHLFGNQETTSPWLPLDASLNAAAQHPDSLAEAAPLLASAAVDESLCNRPFATWSTLAAAPLRTIRPISTAWAMSPDSTPCSVALPT